ncbi:MAG TPA: peptide ABC transporter substrate-binding protein [Anaerolineales bacterium]|nr:peptide ABC transporter substrate-binding protein [Anaerolineales bacterium]
MKKLRWQLFVVAVALVAIAVLLLSQQPELLPGSNPEIEPVTGGIYTEALLGSFGRLNPLLDYYNQADRDINRLIFSSLVKFDHRGLPQGDLVDTWGISQDGKVYNFSIRSDANWHDGQPVTSDDIVFTVELLRSEQIPLPDDLREFWEDVEVIVLDEKTLQFRLPEPFSPFLDYLAFGILPVHHLGDIPAEEILDSEFNLRPVGSGPFQFNSLIVEENEIKGVVLSRFDGYYKDQPFLEQIEFIYYQDSVSALFALQQGEVMGISQVTNDILGEALKSPGMNIYTGRLPQLNLIFFNLGASDKPFLQDAAVRRALLMGLNRNWIIDRIMGGQAILAHGPVFPESWAYYEAIEQVSFDSERATTMLKQAGYTIPAEGGSVRAKEGVALSFELVHPDIPPYPQIAEKIRSDWRVLGVEVNLVSVPYDELISDYLEPRTYDAALVEINFSRSPDPDPYPFWHQAQADAGQNYSQWDDRQASEYLEQARVTVDLNERTRRYRNFQVRFAAELPALALFYPVYSFGISNQVQGVSVGPFYDTSDRFSTITSWFLFSASVDGDGLEATVTP